MTATMLLEILFFYVLISSAVMVGLIVSNRLRTTANRDEIRKMQKKMEEGL